MVAQQKVGKTAAALVLVLVVETQCRVNVNVRLNIPNSGSGSATGHIEVGKILFAGGTTFTSDHRDIVNEVIVFDPRTKETCRVADLPTWPGHSHGGGVNVVDDNGTIIPLICGGLFSYGNCYIYDKSKQKWMTTLGFGEETSNQAMVSLGQWAFSAGSHDLGNYKNSYSVVDRQGVAGPAQVFSPPMILRGACAAVIKEEENTKTIAVVGGRVYQGLERNPRRGKIYKRFLNMTTIFKCDNLNEQPTCKQLPNGPTLKTRHYRSNCGVIEAENGRKVLVAMKDEHPESKVETLDLDDNSAQWEILKGVNIETNIYHGQWNSFIVSQDPRKGYYFPPDKSDDLVHEYYEVTCKSAKECDFKKESLGEFRPRAYFTTISLPTNHGLKCE